MGGNLRGERGFDQEIADKICELIAVDGMTFDKACEACHISRRTGHYWKVDNKDFFDRVRDARGVMGERKIDEIHEIIDALDTTSPNFYYELKKATLKIDTRKWFVGKVMPRIWGDRLAVEHEGAVKHNHTLTEMTDAELEAIIRAGSGGNTGAKEGEK